MTALDLFAITAPGLEAVTAAELRRLGIEPTGAEPGGVSFRGGLAEVYAANLYSRTASRVVARFGDFRATSFRDLERAANRLPWARVAAADRPLQFRVTCRKSRLYHSDAVAERLAESAERATGARAVGAPAAGDDAEPEDGAAQLVIARFLRDRCTVSVDTSGALLHRRGYRLATAKAPLRETLAAAMLLAVGWEGQGPLLDPMCGAGTILIEAALVARRIAPALANPAREPRRFAFSAWPDFDERLWRTLMDRARGEILVSAGVPIAGSDRDAGAVAAAAANAERAGVAGDIIVSRRGVSAIEPPAGGPGWLVTNPPYGIRVGVGDELRDLYASLGSAVRERFPGWTIGLLSADRRLEAQLGIGLVELLRTSNGGIGVRVLRGRVG